MAMEQKQIFRILQDMEGSKIDYTKLVYSSGDNKYFDFTRFGSLSCCYLKLLNGPFGINVAKLKLKEFKNAMDSLKRKNETVIQSK